MNLESLERTLDEGRRRLRELNETCGELEERADRAKGIEQQQLRAQAAAAQTEFDEQARDVDRMKANLEDAKRRAQARANDPRVAQTLATMHAEPKGTRGVWLASHPAVQQFRAISGASSIGAALTPPEYGMTVYDLLAAEAVAIKAGVQVVTTDRDSLIVPHLKADPAAAWTSEAGTITPDSTQDAESLTAIPRKLATLLRCSSEVLLDGAPPVLAVLEKQLFRGLGLGLDLAVFEGSGTPPTPKGLKNVSGIQTVSMGTDGAALANLDPFADAIGGLEQYNAEATAIVMNPRTWKSALKLKELTSGSNKPVLQESAGAGTQGVQRSIYGVPVYLSSQLSTTETQGASGAVCSSAYVIQADQVIVVAKREPQLNAQRGFIDAYSAGSFASTTYGIDGGMTVRLEINAGAYFTSDEQGIRGILRADVLVPNPKAVCRILGIL